ncbi:hypothetical protein RE2895_38810 [Rhodococcus erythropolis]|nr:hypothetical protein RE2895_38810 [Rhodococcus erythropolis]
MVRARRGVNLHTGNPTADARTPKWGASDLTGANASDPTFRRSTRSQHASAKGCAWRGSTSNVGKREPLRCVRCLNFESVIAHAHRHLAEHALRPLNGSDEWECDEELKVRRKTMSAQRQLNAAKKSPAKKDAQPKAKKRKNPNRKRNVPQPKYLQ